MIYANLIRNSRYNDGTTLFWLDHADHLALRRGEPPKQLILDLDSTDDPLHGNQEGCFFHGYYGHYCYLPLYIFCGEHPLCARLRTANIDGAAGSVEDVARLVKQLRQAWPEVRIIVRGDSGFCREELMAWCEAKQVDYVLGLAKNERLAAALSVAKEESRLAMNIRSARSFATLRGCDFFDFRASLGPLNLLFSVQVCGQIQKSHKLSG